MATLKEMAATAKIVTEIGLGQALTELKTYIDAQDAAKGSDIQSISQKLDTLIGAEGGDVDKLLNTFNDIKAFLADYSEDDTLKSLIDAATAAVTAEQTRATGVEGQLRTDLTAETTRATNAETALGDRITPIENISVMSAQEATALYNTIFNPA